MSDELKVEYFMLLNHFKKLGGEEYFEEKGYKDKDMISVRNKIKAIEIQLSAKEIIECTYIANEKIKVQ